MEKEKWYNNFENHIGTLCSMVMVFVLFIQVIARYVFRSAFAWAEELALILFIVSIYTGACAAILRNQHLKLVVLLEKLKPKTRILLEIIGNLIFMFFNGVILFGLIPIILRLKKTGVSTAVLYIPKWINYSVLPVLFVLMTIRLIQDIVRKLIAIKKINE
jgi:TRAP-type C4-dicarboxylate transport system permease small subunit